MTNPRPKGSQNRPKPTRRGNSWEILVPDPTGSRPYISRSFTNKIAGQRWQLDAYDAIDRGLPVPDPEPYRRLTATAPTRPPGPRPRQTVTVGEVMWDWWRITYENEPMSSPSGMIATRTYIQRHIAPYFDHGPHSIADVAELTTEMGHDFMRHLAAHDVEVPTGPGRPSLHEAEWLTVAAAAQRCGVHTAKIKRALASGQLPNHTRKIEAGRTQRGSIRIPVGDLIAAGLLAEAGEEPRRGYSHAYSRGILNTFRRGIQHALAKGYLHHDPLERVFAREPRPVVARKRPDRERPRALTLAEVRQVAGDLHIHHQIALWLQRLLGLRISEAFGLQVEHILDFGDFGLAIVTDQGGTTFHVRDDHGRHQRTSRKKILKTHSSTRVIGITGPLMDLLRVYIEAFHQDPVTGLIQPERPLILGLRDPDNPHQSGYREALMTSFARHGLDYDHLGFHVTPQTLRKSMSAELMFYAHVLPHVRSRILGHRVGPYDGGAQMTAVAYTPDVPDLQPFIDAAKKMTGIVRHQIGDLFIPTTAVPTPSSRAHDQSRAAHTRRVLAAAGYTTTTAEGVDIGELADQLGVTVQTVRHRVAARGVTPVRTIGAAGGVGWIVDDATAEALLDEHARVLENTADRPAHHTVAKLPPEVVTLDKLAQQLQLGYHTVYQWAMTGRIRSYKDEATGRIIVHDDDAARELAEPERVERLRERSLTVREACEALDCGHSMVHHWLRNGRLTRDEQTDQLGATYVTRESIERLQHERPTPQRRVDLHAPPHLISLPDVQKVLGVGRYEVQQLVKQGLLRREDHKRRFHIERSSLEAHLRGR